MLPRPRPLGILLSLLVLPSPTAGRLGPIHRGGEQGGVPYSWLHAVPADVPVVDVPFARPELALGLDDAGRWDAAAHGGRLWRLRVRSPGAPALLVGFERFQLPPGATLFVYDEPHGHVRGAYTAESPRPDGRLALPPLPGDALTLEYHEPAGARGEPELVLGAVLHATLLSLDAPQDSGQEAEPVRRPGPRRRKIASPPCNVDIACPEGDGWRELAESVVAIMVLNEYCTGVLLNNTAQDGTPYVLTAAHCGRLNLATFRFDWLRSTCDDEEGEPGPEEGDLGAAATFLVGDNVLDFQLVRLDRMPPPEFGVVYAGWDRSGAEPEHTACLHHPGGDVMKISLDVDPPKKRKSYWRIGRWETGMTFRGSSGAPLFDPAHRVIGLLKGGDSTCREPVNDSFTRLERIWTAVAPYLDPEGTGAETLNALDPVVTPLVFTVRGPSPAEVPAGTATVQILGAGFSARTAVQLDGEPLGARQVRYLTNSRLEIDLPAELEPGAHELRVESESGEASGTCELQVIAAKGDS